MKKNSPVVNNVWKGAELDAETKALIAKAEQGFAEAQFRLGLTYYFGKGVPQDRKEGIKWWQKAAEQGDATAQAVLAFKYYDGKGVVPQDYKEAVKWFRKSAEQGYDYAQLSLGFRYAKGKGVPKDDVNAYAWYNVASANPGGGGESVSRDFLAKRMTPEQIAKAQELSTLWFEKFQPKE